jgi:antitoxin (DNA-binding transcriptional repressor) of toxin-antitoxin stability system
VRDVGVREFRDHVSEYLSGGEPLAVRKHGRLLGFYLPARRKSDAEELQAAVRDLGESLAELRRATGLSEEELVEELVPKEHENRGRERVGG